MSHSDKGEGAVQTGHFRRHHIKAPVNKECSRQMVKSRLPYDLETTATLLLGCFTILS